jgi:hypothetical protein
MYLTTISYITFLIIFKQVLIYLDTSLNGNISPKEVDDTYSLIEEFYGIDDISEAEFLSVCTSDRRVDALLRINMLENSRTELAKRLQKKRQKIVKLETMGCNVSKSYITLMDDNSLGSTENLSICQRIATFDWICKRYSADRKPNDIEQKNTSDYGTIDKKDYSDGTFELKEEYNDGSINETKDPINGLKHVFGNCYEKI